MSIQEQVARVDARTGGGRTVDARTGGGRTSSVRAAGTARRGVRSQELAVLRDAVATAATPHEITYRGGNVDGRVATRAVGDVSAVFVRYGANVLVEATPTAERFVLTVPLGPMGAGVDRIARTRTAAFVLASASRTLMHPDGREGALVYSLRKERLGAHLESLLGHPPRRPLGFTEVDDANVTTPSHAGAAPGAAAHALDAVCRSVWQTAQEQPEGGTGLTRLMEDQLCTAVLLGLDHSAAAELRAPVADVRPSHARSARDWLAAHLAEPVTVTDLARGIGLSVRQVQHVVRAEYGTTPLGLLRELRLAEAHRLLRAAAPADRTVAGIAHECGITHLGRFAQAYRERYGVTPAQTLTDR